MHIYFVQHFIVFSFKIKFKISMRTKVAVSSVIDGGRKLVEVEEYYTCGEPLFCHAFQTWIIGFSSSDLDTVTFVVGLGYSCVRRKTWLHLCSLSDLNTLEFVEEPLYSCVLRRTWILLRSSSYLDTLALVVGLGYSSVRRRTS